MHLFCRPIPLAFSGVRMPHHINFSRIAGSLLLATGAVLVCVVSGWVWAEGHGSIGGVVQSAGRAVGSHRIMLIRFGPENDVQRTPGETDAQGAFLFQDLPTDAGFTYFVGIRYEDELHRSEQISLHEVANRTDIVLNVDDPSAQALPTNPPARALQVSSHLMVVVKRNDRLEVREIVKILNRRTEASGGSSDAEPGPHGAFRLALPSGYYDLHGIEGDLDSRHVLQHATGLVYTAPLEAGEHNLMFTYALPMEGRVKMIVPRRPLATNALDILVEEQSFAATSDLEFAGRVSIEPHVFTHFRGANLPEGSRSWLQLARRATAPPALRVGVYGLVVAVSLAGVAAPHLRTRKGGPDALLPVGKPTVQQIEELRRTELQLLQRISRLDREHEAGAIGDADYQPRRGDYKAQLCHVLRELQLAGESRNQGV